MSNWTKKLHEQVTRIQEALSCAAAIIVQLDTLSISSTLDSKTIQKYTQCCYSATTGSYANDTIYCRKNVQAGQTHRFLLLLGSQNCHQLGGSLDLNFPYSPSQSLPLINSPT